MLFRTWLLRDTLQKDGEKILCQDRTCPISLLLEALNRDFFHPLAHWHLAMFFGMFLTDALKIGHEMHASFSSPLQWAQPHSLHAGPVHVHLLWTSDEIEPTCKSSTHQWKDMSFCFAIEVGGKKKSALPTAQAEHADQSQTSHKRQENIFLRVHLLANFNQAITS